jgi:hypothetical protein
MKWNVPLCLCDLMFMSEINIPSWVQFYFGTLRSDVNVISSQFNNYHVCRVKYALHPKFKKKNLKALLTSRAQYSSLADSDHGVFFITRK